MDVHMHQLREMQQGLVATVELACKRALKGHFSRLILVGSAALRVETPGSDVDVVCFTRRDGSQAGLPVTVLRKVHWSLKELVSQFHDYMYFSMESWEGRVNQNDWHLDVEGRPALAVKNNVALDPVSGGGWLPSKRKKLRPDPVPPEQPAPPAAHGPKPPEPASGLKPPEVQVTRGLL
eukprot:g27617.t1